MAQQKKLTRSCDICDSVNEWLKGIKPIRLAVINLKIMRLMSQLKFKKYKNFVRAVDVEQAMWKHGINAVDKIVLHYTFSPPLPKGQTEVDGVYKQHKSKIYKGKHYNGVQYNFLIDTDGTINYTRDIRISGGANSNSPKSVAVCYQGGQRKEANVGYDTRTPEQKRAIIDLTKLLMTVFPNIKSIKGHRDVNGYEDPNIPDNLEKDGVTQCPCFWINDDPIYKSINRGTYKF